MRSLGRLVRGLSALFWGLPLALVVCVWTANPQWVKTFGVVPPLASTGLLVSCVGLFFIPVTMLSSFGPQCVQYLAARGTTPGAASGLVYGISTVGNIAGVMLTAFALIPHFPVSTLLYLWLAVAIISLSGLIALLRSSPTPSSP